MMVGETPWSPWQHLGQRYPHVTVYETQLPPGVLGCTNYTDSVWLAYGLTCAEQRCTLAHEIGHLERGPAPSDPLLALREECLIDKWASRRLVRTRDLIRAFQWSQHLPEIAEELWVDLRMLRARLRALTDEEQDAIMDVLGRPRAIS